MTSIFLCVSDAVVDGGAGVRFDVRLGYGNRTQAATGFVVRHAGVAYGWLNQCCHVPMELDWLPGRFFDDEGRHLVCSTHGAVYEPDSGRCIAGPCRGQRLRPIEVVEADREIRWKPDGFVLPP